MKEGHMSTDGYGNRTREDDYPAINISRIRIGGDLGGVVFVVGTVVCLLVGLPETRGFFAGTLAGGVMVAAVIAWWHRGHEHWPGGALVSLGLRRR
jgi:hypothetical protein